MKKLFVLVAALAMAACSGSSSEKPCTGDGDCPQGQSCGADGKCHPNTPADGQDGGPDGGDAQSGDGDSGPKPCTHDRECPPDKICQLSTGQCVAGQTCQESYNCDSSQYCDPVGKVCKTRSALCEPCSDDLQCPDPEMGDMCITYPEGKFCGQRCGVAQCPPGYICDTQAGSGTGPNPGQCRSNTGSCGSTFICHSDDDCAANKVCNLATGKCVPKCQEIGCAAGLVCHGTGHCGEACKGDADCSTYGSGLICCTAPGTPASFCTQSQVGVCRPAGCVLHSECLVTGGNSLGYCDKRTGECKTGCRFGGQAGVMTDCTSGYYCECTSGTVSCDIFDCCPDPGQPEDCVCNPETQSCSNVTVCDNGTCTKIPCYERGVHVSCDAHNLCCGYPLGDFYPCPNGVAEGDCYLADKNAWCGACSEEGKACQTPGLGRGEPGVCLKNQKDGNTYCQPACRDTNDCPATWSCKYSYIQACDQNAPCQVQSNCKLIYKGYDDQGQVQEVNGCHCTTDADCPTDINGFRAVCVNFNICDNTQQPPACTPGKVCQFAKACQSPTGCAVLNGN